MTAKQDMETHFLTSEKFFKAIDKIVWKDDLTYMEATMIVCDEMEIDPEDLVKLKLICPMLKVKLHEEGMASGFLKAESQLPF